MGWNITEFEYPIAYLFQKELVWLSANCNIYFAFKLNSTDNWTYYAGNSGHALGSSKSLTNYGNSESDAQTNYLTTTKDSNNKVLAMLPEIMQARFARMYIDDSTTVQIYEWRPSTYLSAHEIVAGELLLTYQLSDSPQIVVEASGNLSTPIEAVKIGDITGGGEYGIRIRDNDNNIIFDSLTGLQKQVAGWRIVGSSLRTENDEIIMHSGDKHITIASPNNSATSFVSLRYNTGSADVWNAPHIQMGNKNWIGTGSSCYFGFYKNKYLKSAYRDIIVADGVLGLGVNASNPKTWFHMNPNWAATTLEDNSYGFITIETVNNLPGLTILSPNVGGTHTGVISFADPIDAAGAILTFNRNNNKPQFAIGMGYTDRTYPFIIERETNTSASVCIYPYDTNKVSLGTTNHRFRDLSIANGFNVLPMTKVFWSNIGIGAEMVATTLGLYVPLTLNISATYNTYASPPYYMNMYNKVTLGTNDSLFPNTNHGIDLGKTDKEFSTVYCDKVRTSSYMQMGDHQYIVFGSANDQSSVESAITSIDASCKGSTYYSSGGTAWFMIADDTATSISFN